MITFLPLGPRVTETALARISTPANNCCLPTLPNANSYIRRSVVRIEMEDEGKKVERETYFVGESTRGERAG